ncbi:hypothetical protein D3C72_2500550 [compost metagenome]
MLTRLDFGAAMQHLVRSNVVQYEADSLGHVHSRRHGNQFALSQTGELGVCAADRQGCNDLTGFNPGDPTA